MEIQVLEKRENALLHRTEVQFKAVHKAEPTPSRDSLRAELAKELKASKDVIVVDRAASTFGRFETYGYAKIYKSKEEAVSVERPYQLVRNRLKEAEVKEAKPAEKAPRAEKPVKVEKPAKVEAPKAEAEKEEKPPKEAKPAPEKKEEKPAKAPPAKKKEGK